jgi:hypothetical protein
MENKMALDANFEKDFMNSVSHEMDKTQLAGMSKKLAALGNGNYIIDWRWKGTPAFWDILTVRYQIPIKEFTPEKFLKNDIFDEIRILRKGIPVPKFFEIEALVNNSRRHL